MLLYFFFSALMWIFDKALSWLPKIEELPFGADDVLASVVGYVYGFIGLFPPLQIVWTLVLFALGIRMTLLVYHVTKWFIERIH